MISLCKTNFWRGSSKVLCRYFSTDISNNSTQQQWEWEKPEGYDTGIQIRNSYSCFCESKNKFEKVPLIVRDPNHVTWYICGPTVYDSAHIGHALSYIRFDILKRVLTNYFGLNICQVMGITDVDNKLSNRALLYDADIRRVGIYYSNEFKNEMMELNVLPPTLYMPITRIMPQIIHFIADLLKKDRAYTAPQGDVYYMSRASPTPLNKLFQPAYDDDDDDAIFGGRRSLKDFVLWKASRCGEPYWDAPWGKGRPGWHIECSVAGSIAFGGRMDIHSGGFDLIHPHHEFELAQCEAFHQNQQWANYFLHTGQLKIKKSRMKMSKSEGTVWNISDALKSCHPWSLRILALKSQFYQDINLDGFHLHSEAKIIRKILRFKNECNRYLFEISRGNIDECTIEKKIMSLEIDILTALKDNLNWHDAFQYLLEFMNFIYDELSPSKGSGSSQFDDIRNPTAVVKAKQVVEKHLTNLGFPTLQENQMKTNPLFDKIPPTS